MIHRGILFGDGVFEVIVVRRGVPFRPEAHLARLMESARTMGMGKSALACRDELAREIRSAAGTVRVADVGYLKVVLARKGDTNLDPPDREEGVTPLVFCRPHSVDARAAREGIAAITMRFAASAVPGAKTLSYASSIVARMAARNAGASEALAVDLLGHVNEGATSNVLCVLGTGNDRRLVAPCEGALRGITRAAVIEVATLPVEERTVTVDTLRSASEVFITSSIRGIWPVVRVDGAPIGDGTVGATTRELAAAYEALVTEECASA